MQIPIRFIDRNFQHLSTLYVILQEMCYLQTKKTEISVYTLCARAKIIKILYLQALFRRCRAILRLLGKFHRQIVVLLHRESHQRKFHFHRCSDHRTISNTTVTSKKKTIRIKKRHRDGTAFGCIYPYPFFEQNCGRIFH